MQTRNKQLFGGFESCINNTVKLVSSYLVYLFSSYSQDNLGIEIMPLKKTGA